MSMDSSTIFAMLFPLGTLEETSDTTFSWTLVAHVDKVKAAGVEFNPEARTLTSVQGIASSGSAHQVPHQLCWRPIVGTPLTCSPNSLPPPPSSPLPPSPPPPARACATPRQCILWLSTSINQSFLPSLNQFLHNAGHGTPQTVNCPIPLIQRGVCTQDTLAKGPSSWSPPMMSAHALQS